MNFNDVKKLIADHDIKRVDLRVTDMPGRWHQFTIPVERLTEKLFDEGQGFDGSSLRGFQEIHESDMLLMPDLTSARVEPISEIGTLVLTCSVKDPITGQAYNRDPRNIAKNTVVIIVAYIFSIFSSTALIAINLIVLIIVISFCLRLLM